jgi:hypothetical protein
LSCPSTCAACDSFTWCSGCKDGFRLVSGACVV